MLLYLVRHAIAYDGNPQIWTDDRDRPLTRAGQRRFRRAARGLRVLAQPVDAVLSSPYVRAWQTAQILQRVAHWPAPEPLPALESGNDPAAVLSAIEPYEVAGAVALVGHEPGLSQLATLLLAGAGGDVAIVFRKGSVACLQLDGPPAPRGAALLWHATPKLLRAAT
jgi:phosphohistidine phosphatase